MAPFSKPTTMVCLILASAHLGLGSAATSPPSIQPFSLADVSLDNATDFAEGAALNHEYLLMLDPDNLVYNFRTTAGLPAPGQSYGGWEGPTVEVRGQFIGHYLSALAFAAKSTGDAAFAARADAVVAALAECQAAWGDGYLAAFPKSFLDRLEALEPVWAPLYVLHKIVAGLLDQHQLMAQRQALGVATGLADYLCTRFEKVVAEKGEDHWQQMLETEFGGMNEVLYKMYMETNEPSYARCAALFDKPAWFDAMREGRDTLGGLHANTHLAQVNGFAARYEATGDEEAGTAVANFFSTALRRHSYSTGGSNWFEFWHKPSSLGDAVNNTDAGANAQESCTQYNILKIARALFRWTGDAQVADFYERGILNGVMGIQRKPHPHSHSHPHARFHPHSRARPTPDLPHSHAHSLAELRTRAAADDGDAAPAPAALLPSEEAAVAATNAAHARVGATRPADPRVVSWPDDPAAGINSAVAGTDEVAPGVYIYYLPLASGLWKGDNGHVWTKGWGDRFNSFWCCYGTAVESFSKLADSIYFHRAPDGYETAAAKSRSDENQAKAAASGINQPRLDSGSGMGNEGGVAVAGPRRPAELFVNQLVSSTLRWRQLGVTLTQRADLYPATDNVARSQLGIAVDPAPSRSSNNASTTATAGASSGASASFVLHWRIPSWADEDAIELRVDGRVVDVPALLQLAGSSRASGSGSRLRFNPPQFGRGAAYAPLGPGFKDGCVVEASMPMRITTEDLNDARPEMQALKAVLLGPHLMAGLTDGPNDIDVDPANIAAAVSLPNATALVSLSAGGGSDGALRLLRHSAGGSKIEVGALPPGSSWAAAMDATFLLVDAPLRTNCKAVSEDGQGRQVWAESMARPGHFLVSAGAGGWELRRRNAHAYAAEDACAAGFTVHGDLDAALRSMRGGGSSDGAALRLVHPASGAALTAVAPAAAEYPKGARVLRGSALSYLLVPLGQIIDEHYTAYFKFGSAPALRAGGEGHAAVAEA